MIANQGLTTKSTRQAWRVRILFGLIVLQIDTSSISDRPHRHHPPGGSEESCPSETHPIRPPPGDHPERLTLLAGRAPHGTGLAADRDVNHPGTPPVAGRPGGQDHLVGTSGSSLGL